MRRLTARRRNTLRYCALRPIRYSLFAMLSDIARRSISFHSIRFEPSRDPAVLEQPVHVRARLAECQRHDAAVERISEQDLEQIGGRAGRLRANLDDRRQAPVMMVGHVAHARTNSPERQIVSR